MTSPTLIYDLTAEVLEVAWDGLVAGLPDGLRPDERAVVNGPPAWDQWAGCGNTVLAWASTITPSIVPPAPAEGVILCQIPHPLTAINILTLRCEPTVDDNGALPSLEAMDAAARLVLVDAWLVWQAISCWAVAQQEDEDYAVAITQSAAPPQGPQGALAGWQTTVVVAVDNAACCDPERFVPVPDAWWPAPQFG